MPQVRSGELDEARLLPGAEKRERDVRKALSRLAEHKSWYLFVSEAHAMSTESARCRNGNHACGEVTRWRGDVERFAPDAVDVFDGLIQHALDHPAVLPPTGRTCRTE